ncbi:MAG: hypothetical protein E7F58_13070 [Clostridium saudiense]|jgi:hypothetical protein|uniref:hypothetical protein n=1 Tax=Clostridium saudiense TaxID=1414720 RepID=UPI002913AA74|nr:hypothetical protein [Clostridium saudiense]MDU3522572.1 hypothetical protein [Clostridium saudiense]
MDNEEEYILLSTSEREELKKAYEIIEKVKETIDVDYEEYAAIKTALSYLNNAINYKEKFLS